MHAHSQRGSLSFGNCYCTCAGSKEGYRLYTFDHNTGELRLDLQQPWFSALSPRPILPPQDQLCDAEVFDSLINQVPCDDTHSVDIGLCSQVYGPQARRMHQIRLFCYACRRCTMNFTLCAG